MPNEADTCRRYVLPKLQAGGWEDEPHHTNEPANTVRQLQIIVYSD